MIFKRDKVSWSKGSGKSVVFVKKNLDNNKNIEKLHLIAKKLIAEGKTIEAWKTLLINKIIKK